MKFKVNAIKDKAEYMKKIPNVRVKAKCIHSNIYN